MPRCRPYKPTAHAPYRVRPLPSPAETGADGRRHQRAPRARSRQSTGRIPSRIPWNGCWLLTADAIRERHVPDAVSARAHFVAHSVKRVLTADAIRERHVPDAVRAPGAFRRAFRYGDRGTALYKYPVSNSQLSEPALRLAPPPPRSLRCCQQEERVRSSRQPLGRPPAW